MPFPQKIETYITRSRLLSRSELYIVALSGGADSVALLLCLHSLGYRVEAAHCNFRLRGAEADRDEAFAARLCAESRIPFHRIHFDTREYAALHRQSIELAARELRYRWFESLRRDLGAEAICVAHHADDNVETCLMRLCRGTGLHGLTAMQPLNGRIVRPLLCVTRAEIEAWLNDIGQTWVTDSTNLQTDATRNIFRLRVIPALTTAYPAAAQNITATIARLRQAEKVVSQAVNQWRAQVLTTTPAGDTALDLTRLREFPAPELLLHEILKDYGFTPAQATSIYQNLGAQTGKLWHSPTHDAAIHRRRLLIAPHYTPPAPMLIPETGTYIIGPHTLTLNRGAWALARDKAQAQQNGACASESDKTQAQQNGACVSESIHAQAPQQTGLQHALTLDLATVHFPLTIRPTEPGDRFRPFGMSGTRLVSDWMTDRHLSVLDKRRAIVAVDRYGTIIAIAGREIADQCRVTDSTAQVIELRVKS